MATERHSALTLVPYVHTEALEFPALAETETSEVNENVSADKQRTSPEK